MRNPCRERMNLGDLTVTETLPEGLLESRVHELGRVLNGPTLIHLPGRSPQPLFVSVLMHGNEDTGFEAVQQVLRRHKGETLPRAMSLFIGNIEAAAHNVRTLPHQMDYNRVWPGTLSPLCPEAEMMRAVVDNMRSRKPFASIDIHNNTGRNPHYACVRRLDQAWLHLARLFSRIVVFFERPLGVQAGAMADLCPAVTVECGRIGTLTGMEHAMEFIEACLRLSQFPEQAIAPGDVELLRTVAILKVPHDVEFSFDGSEADILFRNDIDELNFSPVATGTSLALLGKESDARLEVCSGGDYDLSEEFLDYSNGEIRFARSVVPAMLTTDPEAIRQDCLGYLMESLDLNADPRAP